MSYDTDSSKVKLKSCQVEEFQVLEPGLEAYVTWLAELQNWHLIL